MGSRTSRIAHVTRILNRLHVEYDREHDVEQLARDAGMSLSAFHAHFKGLTATSPLQYLKTIRLHRARMLMGNERMTASEAAARVDYESVSQFSREFKRLFGDTPRNVTSQLHAVLAERGLTRMNGTLGFGD